MARVIEIDQTITVGHLAHQLELPATDLISELFKNGLMLTLNEKIDFDTVSILIDELGLDITVKQKESTLPKHGVRQRENPVNKQRPPVVAVMGHVDHGKTTLLDKIKGSDRVSAEAGGITQHISAMQIRHNDKYITFLDTPGHEAFAAAREHGVLLTDLVILVVAADDGVKKQTLEAIRFAKKSKAKILVAITKTDKKAANINLIKQQLAEHDLLAEDMGGQTVVIPLSSHTGEGIEQLLDMILLLAEIDDLKADSRGLASGIVVEAYLRQGLGPVAVVLVQEGVLRLGDLLVAGGAWGKVRCLQDMDGRNLDKALASTPVVVSGFKALPEFGYEFMTVSSEKEAKKLVTAYNRHAQVKSSGMSNREFLRLIGQRTEINQYKILVKADVHGSLTAVLNGLKRLDTAKVATRVINSGVGTISENDISIARISQATIYGFNLDISTPMRKLANQTGVKVKVYSVIYELFDDVTKELEALLAPKIIRQDIGGLQIKEVFKTSKSEIICGGEVLKGKISLPLIADVHRGQQLLAEEIEVLSLARGPNEVKEAKPGALCGVRLSVQSKLLLQADDRLRFYRKKTVAQKLTV